MVSHDKWYYIKQISARGDRYGNLLLEMMHKYNCSNTMDITLEQAKEFYEGLIGQA